MLTPIRRLVAVEESEVANVLGPDTVSGLARNFLPHAVANVVEAGNNLRAALVRSGFAHDLDGCHNSPKLSRCASSAARALACAFVYRINMSGRVQPATAIRPPSEPPLDSQRCAAVCRSRCGWNPSMPAMSARMASVLCNAS